MAVLGDVFDSLQTMSQVQLLLAFIACMGYAFAQGNMLPVKGKRLAWVAAALASTGFALQSSDWTHAAMLLGFAVAGLGSFVALVWITSRALGFARSSPRAEPDAALGEAPLAPTSATPSRPGRAGDHAHSV